MSLLAPRPSSYHALRICATPDQAGDRTARRTSRRQGRWSGAVSAGPLLVSRPELDFTYRGWVSCGSSGRPVLEPVRAVLAWSEDTALSPRAREFIRFAASIS